MTNDYQYFGLKSSSEGVADFVKHIINSNLTFEEKGEQKTPVCIWGDHGIGKTELVKEIANDLNFKWAYIAPAQFEEMGDLLGMPKVVENETIFAPPQWVPKDEGPGILLIDDVNRADDRILRGIMQLLQNYELVSWKLPKNWQIVLTANPDGGDYSVTPMDNALLTRMMHITMQFDVKSWGRWAEEKKIDPRGINFVLSYPEIVTGTRTTPRTLVQFFNSIKSIPKLEDHLPLIQTLGASCLDEETVSAFITFVQQNLSELIEPSQILNAKNFEKEVRKNIEAVVIKDIIRVDILATICSRLSNFLIVNKTNPSKEQIQNIQAFIKMDVLPNDLRLAFLQDLISSKNNHLKTIMNDPEVSMMLLKNM
ncbi:AAA family ATPase [Cellulophaga baltica]|uniref:AAA domain (Dynein-related subfamily) n=1 Tax=Cellulophaga baltica TaxID=76594 RepID=A0A1G7ISP8_9FLAO|nr:AAA family ATPase [Cellulophaga baltica]SDF15693.1 AAA domain (dynein-related subfamily) [Cellulophaga baltica]